MGGLMSFELIWEDKPTFAFFLIGCNSNESKLLPIEDFSIFKFFPRFLNFDLY